MPYVSGQVSVGTTATLIATVGAVPENDGILINASAACFVGPPGVTATTGFAVQPNVPTPVPTTGAESLTLYGITSTGTSTVSYIYPG
jgi:hypothetical protein